VALSINVRNEGNAVVISLAGAADANMLAPLRDPLTAALGDTGLVVLDLDELTIGEPDALRKLIVDVLDNGRGGRLRIAAGDDATLGALAEARVHHLVAVHRTIEEARLAQDAERVG